MARWRFVVSNRSMIGLARKVFRRLMATENGAACEVTAAESVLGELLANAFMHGYAKDVEISAYPIGPWMRLCVTSQGPAFDFRPRTPSPTECGGRGFLIIAALASEISVKREASFNTVAVSLPLIGSGDRSVSSSLGQRSSQ